MSACPHFDALLVGGLCYWDIKQRALNGSRAKLSLDQLQFVGFDLAPPPPPPPGWRPASSILPAFDGTEDGDPEATRGIRYLMKVGKDRMELSI